MDPIDILLPFFRELSEATKLVIFLLLLGLAILLAVSQILSYRRVGDLEKDLRRKDEALQKAQEERDQLQARFQAFDQIDNHVWKKPDAFENACFLPRDQRKARFIAVCNLKGGVGKTTLTLNLGLCLAMQGKKVLLVDLDYQGTLSNLLLDRDLVTDYRRRGWTSSALLKAKLVATDLQQYMFPSSDERRCQVIIAQETLEVTEFEQQSRFFVDAQQEVRFLLQRLLHAPPVCQEFDYVLFDCPPRMSTACVNALAAADYVLVPTTLSQLDIEAVPRTLNWLKELHAVTKATFLGVVITRARMRGSQLVSYEEKQLGSLNNIIEKHQAGKGYVFQAMIPDSPKIHQLSMQRKAAAVHLPEGRKWFDAVGQELERKMQP